MPVWTRSVRLAEAVPGLIRHLPQHKPWMVALSLIAAVVVVGTCSLGSYMLVNSDDSVLGGAAAPTPTVHLRDITSREADPDQLTVADVFPQAEITVDAAVPPYKAVGEPQATADCRLGATADLGKLLVELGCNQLVRGTFVSTEGTYLVTAGIFNLVDNAAAVKANADIKLLVDDNKGRFSGYVSGTQARPLGRSATKLSWSSEGHFLIYTVIARLDGKDFDEPDLAHVTVIVYDMVETHLRRHVLVTWATDTSAEQSPEPSASATG